MSAIPQGAVGPDGSRAPARWWPREAGLSRLLGITRSIVRTARTVVHLPELVALRWILVVGFAVRFMLAPLTSWGVDTPSFILADLGLLYTGSPYTSSLFFNPPLGPYLEAPFLTFATLFASPQALVPVVSAVAPAAQATGMASVLVPTPMALMMLKIPLILADGGSTLLLFLLVRQRTGEAIAKTVAAAWFLNPVLIWSSAVHGEVDGIAACFLLLFLLALERRYVTIAGAALSLAVFAKPFVVGVIPLGLAFLAVGAGSEMLSRRDRGLQVARFVGGGLIGALPFVIYIPALLAQLSQSVNNPLLGGMSPLILFNGAVPKLPGIWGSWQNRATASDLLSLLRALALAAVAGSLLLLFLWKRYRRLSPQGVDAFSVLAFASLWAMVGVILSDSVPQSENMIPPLALLLLASPVAPRALRVAYVSLSAAAFGLYMALLTPLAYFYPLAVLLGPSEIDFINRTVISYAKLRGLFSQPGAWLVCGLVAGVTLLGIMALGFIRLVGVATSGRTRRLPVETGGAHE